MRFARESWQVGHGTNQAVNTALFLRDTLALSVDTVPELPGLDPSVPVFIPRGVDRAGVTEEWLGWWADVLDHARAETPIDVRSIPTNEDSTSLLTRPALRAAVRALRHEGARLDLVEDVDEGALRSALERGTREAVVDPVGDEHRPDA